MMLLVLLASLALSQDAIGESPVDAEAPQVVSLAPSAEPADLEGHPSLAPTPSPDDELYARLFGSTEDVVSPAGGALLSTEAPRRPLGWLGWVLGAIGLAAGFWIYKLRGRQVLAGLKLPGVSPAAPPALAVLARASLGGSSTLALVEVEDADGLRRRLLVGSGSGGPQLLSELHAPDAGPQALPLAAPVATPAPAVAPEPRPEPQPAPRRAEVRPQPEPPDPWPDYTRSRDEARAGRAPRRPRHAMAGRFRQADASTRSGATLQPVRTAVEARSLVEEALASRKAKVA